MSTDPSVSPRDPLASLPAATATAVRAELRAGERVAYASVPLPLPYAQFTPVVALGKRFAPGAAAVGTLLAVISVILLLVDGFETLLLLPLLLVPGLALRGLLEWMRVRSVRRKAESSACLVTDQRAILLETAPERTVNAVEARDISEVYCWPASTAIGEIRSRIGNAPNAEPTLWVVPDPRACEAAMRALQARAGSAAAGGGHSAAASAPSA
jgi:hypothetical protein